MQPGVAGVAGVEVPVARCESSESRRWIEPIAAEVFLLQRLFDRCSVAFCPVSSNRIKTIDLAESRYKSKRPKAIKDRYAMTCIDSSGVSEVVK